MESKSVLEALWDKGVQPEIISFLEGLDWTFIIMFTTILYGLKHTRHFDWFEKILEKANIHSFKVWVSALVTSTVFCFFKWKEGLIDYSYVSALLRSMFFVVVFSNIFVDIPVFLIKKLGSIIDKKDAPPAPVVKRKKRT